MFTVLRLRLGSALAFLPSPCSRPLPEASQETRLQMGWVSCFFSCSVMPLSPRHPKRTEDGPLALLDRCCAPLQRLGPRCKPLPTCNEEVCFWVS